MDSGNRSFVKGGPYFEGIFVIAGEARFRGRTLLGKDTLARRCAGFAVCDFNELQMARDTDDLIAYILNLRTPNR